MYMYRGDQVWTCIGLDGINIHGAIDRHRARKSLVGPGAVCQFLYISHIIFKKCMIFNYFLAV